MADEKNGNAADAADSPEEAVKGAEKKKKVSKPKENGSAETVQKETKENREKSGKKDGKAAGGKDKDGKAGKDGGKQGKAKAKRKGGAIKLALILIPVALIAVCVTALILNLYGARDYVGSLLKEPFLAAVTWLDPEYTSVYDEMKEKNDKRVKALDEREAALDQREKELNAEADSVRAELETRKTEAATREQELSERTALLDKREAAFKQQQEDQALATAPALERELTETEIAYFQSLSRTYSNMSPENAARVLEEIYSPEDAALIIHYMSERGAAAIFDVMDVNLAARLTEILLAAG